MTTVNTIGDVRSAIYSGETTIHPGNTKMRVALAFCAKNPNGIKPKVGALTEGVLITIVICTTIVALYALFKGHNVKITRKGNGDYTIETSN